MDRLNAWAPRVLSVLRIVAALLFMEHGLMKIFGFPAALPGGGGPLPPLMLAAGWIEIVGGALLALGLFTRPVAFILSGEIIFGGLLALGLFTRPAAFILSGEMAVAYFMAHAPQGFHPVLNKGEAAVLYCFLFFYFVFSGPGPWSLDAALRKRA